MFFSLAITACKKTSEDGGSTGSTDNPGPTVDSRAVSFSYAIPSLIQQLNPSTSEAERFTPDQILRGSLYVLNTDDSTDATYDRTIIPIPCNSILATHGSLNYFLSEQIFIFTLT